MDKHCVPVLYSAQMSKCWASHLSFDGKGLNTICLDSITPKTKENTYFALIQVVKLHSIAMVYGTSNYVYIYMYIHVLFFWGSETNCIQLEYTDHLCSILLISHDWEWFPILHGSSERTARSLPSKHVFLDMIVGLQSPL